MEKKDTYGRPLRRGSRVRFEPIDGNHYERCDDEGTIIEILSNRAWNRILYFVRWDDDPEIYEFGGFHLSRIKW